MKRIILAAASDKHGGHTLGLLHPDTVLEYTNQQTGEVVKWKPVLKEWQKFLADIHFTDHIKTAKELAGKDEIVVFDVGDLTQGNKYPNEQVSTRISDQFEIAAWNLRPWLNLPNVKTVRIGIGTSAHNFGEGVSEIITQRRLQGWFPKKDIKVVYHGLASLAGVAIDYAHHGPSPGSRNWLRGNEARYYLRSLIEDEIDFGNAPPHLVIRADYHTYVEEFLSKFFRGIRYKSWLTILPALCGMSDYARKATKSTAKITIGMCFYEIVNGKILDIYPAFQTLDIRTKEVLA